MSGKSVKKITAYLFILRLFRMSISVVTLLFSAKYFGVSMQRDVWVLISTLITAIAGALFGPINETFRAKFVFIKEQEGEIKAMSMTASLITWMTFIIISVGVVMVIARSQIGMVLYPDEITKSSIDVFSKLLLIMIPTLLLSQWTNIGISILNTYEVYYIPEIVGTITGLVNIGIIVWLAPSMGIFSLAVSSYFSSLLLLSVVIYYLFKTNIFSLLKSVSVKNLKFKEFLTFLIFASPFYFPYFIGQCNSLVEKWLSGLLGQGMISSLEYARQFTVVIQSVLSGIISTLMLPLISKAFVRNEKDVYEKVFKDNLSVCFAILSITITVLFGASEPLCQFFFNRGSISETSLTIISNLMRCYAIAFIGVMLYIIFGNTMLASDQRKKYAIIGVGVQIFVILANLVLVNYIGIYTFPLSFGLAHFIGSMLMFQSIHLENSSKTLLTIIRYSIVLIIIGCSLRVFNHYVDFSSSLLQLCVNVPVLGLLILILSRHLDIDAYSYLRKILH